VLVALALIGATAVLLNDVIDFPGHVGIWTFALLAVFIYALLSLNGLIGGAIYLWDRRRVVLALSGEK
jgi:hypothetical protein